MLRCHMKNNLFCCSFFMKHHWGKLSSAHLALILKWPHVKKYVKWNCVSCSLVTVNTQTVVDMCDLHSAEKIIFWKVSFILTSSLGFTAACLMMSCSRIIRHLRVLSHTNNESTPKMPRTVSSLSSSTSTAPPPLMVDIFNLIKACQLYWFWHFQLWHSRLWAPWAVDLLICDEGPYQRGTTWTRSLFVFLIALRCLLETLMYGCCLRPTPLLLPIINPSLDRSLLFNLCCS